MLGAEFLAVVSAAYNVQLDYFAANMIATKRKFAMCARVQLLIWSRASELIAYKHCGLQHR